jgi:hypothetical protein
MLLQFVARRHFFFVLPAVAGSASASLSTLPTTPRPSPDYS